MRGLTVTERFVMLKTIGGYVPNHVEPLSAEISSAIQQLAKDGRLVILPPNDPRGDFSTEATHLGKLALRLDIERSDPNAKPR